MMSKSILQEMNDYPQKKYNLPVSADLTLGVSLGSHLEVEEFDCNETYDEGFFIVNGFEDDLLPLIDSWKEVYQSVEYEYLKDPEEIYMSWSDLFVPKKTINPVYGTTRRKISAKVTIKM